MSFFNSSRVLAAVLAVSLSTSLASAQSLTIDPTPLPDGNRGTAYTAFLSASGGKGGPLVFRVVEGKLPAGLKLERSFGVQSALIFGTPREEGSSTFTVRVEDTAGNTATQEFTIVIQAPLPLEITNPSSTLREGAVGEPYSASLFVSGGVAPYRWEITAGALPPGLRLRENQITGTPETAGTFTFTATVTDRDGTTASREFTINVL